MEAADLEAYRVIETKPRRVGVHGFGVLARGDDLDDVLGTMQAAAATMPGDPLTSPAAARALVHALRAPTGAPRPPTWSRPTPTATSAR